MIKKIVEIPVTGDSYPFASAEKYCGLSSLGYAETEYYMEGTANVYRTAPDGSIQVKTPDAPYVNRFIVRAPEDAEKCSGHVVVEIINATSGMEIDRMWILGYREFIRRGDIYVGITSKHATLPKLLEFDAVRYGRLSWANPTPDEPFPFTREDVLNTPNMLPDQDITQEPGLFWDMLSDLPEVLKSGREDNPLKKYAPRTVALTGWSQSADYMIRYINDFVYSYRPGEDIYDGFLLAGPPRFFVTPVNQYETLKPAAAAQMTIHYMRNPMIILQTECENGRLGGSLVSRRNGDAPDYLCREYDITGASHDTMDSYVRYYQNDEDLIRIRHLPEYVGKNEVANNYPTHFAVAAAFRNLFAWIEEGRAPAACPLIEVNGQGENVKDALGVTKGGLRTCLLDYPTGAYYNYSDIELGANPIFPKLDKEILFGHEEPFPPQMLSYLYGSLDHYRELAEANTDEQIAGGFIVKEDREALVEFAVSLAAARGLR